MYVIVDRGRDVSSHAGWEWRPVLPFEEPHTYPRVEDAASALAMEMDEYDIDLDKVDIYFLVPVGHEYLVHLLKEVRERQK